MNLVIVESPTKARTLSRFLGDDYHIAASMGHLVDLPKSTLGVDIEKNFKPEWIEVVGKEEIIKSLKNKAKGADSIILATDPDREGEAIASHVKDVLSSNLKFKVQNSKFQRIVFHEITKEAVLEALKNPRDINLHLVDAQTARRVLDRLVGYKLSPLLWKKVRRGLSAGRVQSVALRLIVEREREIEKFKKEIYWTIIAKLVKGTKEARETEAEFELIEINGKKIEEKETFDLYDGEYAVTKTSIASQERADEIITDLKRQKFEVCEVLQKEVKRTPPPPLTTSTLQQEAARRLRFSGKRTMSLAQKLYEEGFITYHRTDSVNIANSALFTIRNFIKKEYPERYLPEKPRFYKTRQKLAQEAHEAIRPTDVGELQAQSSKLKAQIGGEIAKLYELIWRRAIAAQMAEAIIESTTVLVDASPAYRFKTTGSVVIFDGFLKLYPQALEDKKLPKFKALEPLYLSGLNAGIHETQPPPRYNYAHLVATLEKNGIGRPSTYAPIISTIEDRQYVELDPSRRFVPTPVGIAVNDFLVYNFSDIDDIPFTARMEDDLDEVAHGKKDWEPIVQEFYKPFSEKLEGAEKQGRVKIETEKTDEVCDKCGSPMVIRIGRFGRFISCSRFPKCDFTKTLVEKTNIVCSKCGGEVIIKRTKKGKKFYGCSNYPKCDFASWKKPS